MGFLKDFARDRDPIQPGIDTSKGPIYYSGAIIIGFWVLSVPTTPLLMLIFRSDLPLTVWTALVERLFIATMITAGVMVSGVVLSRYRKHGLPRRMAIESMDIERIGAGASKHVVKWKPYDKIPGVMKHWIPASLYGVGDWFVEMLIRLTGGRPSPLVEVPPGFDPCDIPPNQFNDPTFDCDGEGGEVDEPNSRPDSFGGLRDMLRRRGFR